MLIIMAVIIFRLAHLDANIETVDSRRDQTGDLMALVRIFTTVRTYNSYFADLTIYFPWIFPKSVNYCQMRSNCLETWKIMISEGEGHADILS